VPVVLVVRAEPVAPAESEGRVAWAVPGVLPIRMAAHP